MYILCFLASFFLNTDIVFNENTLKDSVFETKQICVPGYIGAFNPSLLSYKDGYLLSFRVASKCAKEIKNNFRSDYSIIGVVRLDKQFQAVPETSQILPVASYSTAFSLTAEDARLVQVGNKILVIFNDCHSNLATDGNVMYFSELSERDGIFSLSYPAKPFIYPSAGGVEKNWSPFALGEKLYLIYSDNPRIILEADVYTGHCSEVTRNVSYTAWQFGQVRGGSPALTLENQFLTFFHSSMFVQETKKRTYFMGAYTFDRHFPFSIRSMTPIPIGDPDYYFHNNSSKKVIFPGGIAIDGNLVHVAWGKSDKEVWITTFDKEKLFELMKPITPPPEKAGVFLLNKEGKEKKQT